MNQDFTAASAVPFTSSVGEIIDLTQACAMTQNYRQAQLHDTRAVFMGREVLEKLLAQNGAIGLRCYYALNELRQLTLVMVAADANGEDILEMAADRCIPCPSSCAVRSPLMG